MNDVLRTVMTLGSYSIIIPTIICLIRWKRLQSEQQTLAYLVLLSLLVEGIALLVGKVMGMNNLFLLHLFTHAELWLVVLIFHNTTNSQSAKRWYVMLGIIFSSFALVNSLFFETWEVFNVTTRIFEAILITSFAAFYYYETSIELNEKHLERIPMFWLTTGLFLYFSSSLFVYLFSNYILPDERTSLFVWAIHAFLGIIKNLFFTLVLWMKRPS